MIEVIDPDGVPPAGSGYFITETAARGVYPEGEISGRSQDKRSRTFVEDIGVAIATVSKEVTDLSLEATAKLAKQMADQGGG